MELHVSNNAKNKTAHSILITGAARSGTTIVGKIVHSFDKVEYSFEPPMMFSLLPLLNKIPESEWKLLYETFLYEHFFMDAVCGRNLNLNLKDDSSIYNVKEKSEVEGRLNISVRKEDAESFFKEHKIAFKMPDVTPFIKKLMLYYPDMKVVAIRRDPVSTISSLMMKGWFADEAVRSNYDWPFYLNEDGIRIPYWIEPDDFHRWFEMKEVDRCAYYYLRMNDGLDRLNNSCEINYSSLLNKPSDEVKKIASFLDVSFGSMTESIIHGIRPMGSKQDYSILNKIDNDLSDRLAFYVEA